MDISSRPVQERTHGVLSETTVKGTHSHHIAWKISLFIVTSGLLMAYVYFSICERNDHSYCEIKNFSSALSFLNDIHGIFS